MKIKVGSKKLVICRNKPRIKARAIYRHRNMRLFWLGPIFIGVYYNSGASGGTA